ncbi:hypothetical protein ACM66B_004415 [Microbotryomycetes sp. NB124-2]
MSAHDVFSPPPTSPIRSDFAAEPASPAHSSADSVAPPISDIISLDSMSERAHSDDSASECDDSGSVDFEMIRSHDFSEISGHSAARQSSNGGNNTISSQSQQSVDARMSLSFPDPLAPVSDSASDSAAGTSDSLESYSLLLDATPPNAHTLETTPAPQTHVSEKATLNKGSAIATWLEHTKQSGVGSPPVYSPRNAASLEEDDAVSTISLFSSPDQRERAPAQHLHLHVSFVGGSIEERNAVLQRLAKVHGLQVIVEPIDCSMPSRLVVHFSDYKVGMTDNLLEPLMSSHNTVLQVSSGDMSLSTSLASIPSASSSMTILASSVGLHQSLSTVATTRAHPPLSTMSMSKLESTTDDELRRAVASAIVECADRHASSTPPSLLRFALLVCFLASWIAFSDPWAHSAPPKPATSTPSVKHTSSPALVPLLPSAPKLGLLDPAPMSQASLCSFATPLSCALSLVTDSNATLQSFLSAPSVPAPVKPTGKDARRHKTRRIRKQPRADKGRRDMPSFREAVGIVGRKAQARGQDCARRWRVSRPSSRVFAHKIRSHFRRAHRQSKRLRERFDTESWGLGQEKRSLCKVAAKWGQHELLRAQGHGLRSLYEVARDWSSERRLREQSKRVLDDSKVKLVSFARASRQVVDWRLRKHVQDSQWLKWLEHARVVSKSRVRKAGKTARAVRQGKLAWQDVVCAVKVRDRVRCNEMRQRSFKVRLLS